MSHTMISAGTHQAYRHEAVLYHGADGLLSATVPFIREGLSAAQPVLVAVAQPRLDLIREALGEDASSVDLVDMAELGGNPARIMSAWRTFVDGAGDLRPVRGVGEPIWAGRRDPELAECQLHESLLNVAIDPDTPLWLRCPYDVDSLSDSVIVEAQRSHPILVEDDSCRGSTLYGGIAHSDAVFARALPEPAAPSEELPFGPDDLPAVRAIVIRHAREAALSGDRAADLTMAVHEIAVNSLRHGGGEGLLRLWREASALVCEISGRGRIEDPLAGRAAPPDSGEGGRGLWLANQLCDLVQVRTTPAGSTVRLFSWL